MGSVRLFDKVVVWLVGLMIIWVVWVVSVVILVVCVCLLVLMMVLILLLEYLNVILLVCGNIYLGCRLLGIRVCVFEMSVFRFKIV